MKTYCVKCRKNTGNLKSKICKTKNSRLIMQSKCANCEIKKSRLFVKEQEAKAVLSSLGLKTGLGKIPLFGDKFMPEKYLKQPGFIYSAVIELKSLCRLEIQILFTEMSLIRLVFDMICFMVNQKT